MIKEDIDSKQKEISLTLNATKAARTHVNGYPILESTATEADHATRPGHVILVQRDQEHQPFVTAWLGEGDTGWTWGHYFQDRADAEGDYRSRCKRGY